MAFRPQDIAISDTTGKYPSKTEIGLDGETLRVITDGDPYPAAAGNPLINDGTSQRKGFLGNNKISDQSRDLTFTYRATRNSENLTDRSTGPVGIAANGAYLYSPAHPIGSLPNSLKDPHPGLNYNIVHFKDVFNLDASQGSPTAFGEYGYYSGAFIFSTWQDSKVYNSNNYYAVDSFGKDHLRTTQGHSKIIGFAFDGYPVYGPYGYSEPLESSSRISIMKSSYRLKQSDSHRPSKYKESDTVDINGDLVNLDLGSFIQDYEYIEGLGTLDKQNGRYCKTPEYPNGTYAYFITFDNQTSQVPAYPYIFGDQTKQARTAGIGAERYVESLWNLLSGNVLSTLVERNTVELRLPIANGVSPRLEIIAGSLPGGLRLDGEAIKGTPFEVERDTLSRFVIRAHFNGRVEDRTFEIITSGPDEPYWITPAGLLDAGPSKHYFVLDNELIDYQLVAQDNDLPAGDILTYFIAEGDGALPPGLTLTNEGKIQGIVEPLFALPRSAKDSGYDQDLYDSVQSDFNVKSTNGYSTYYYDVDTYDFNVPTLIPKKLNRYYPFIVTVTDGDTFIKREFKIYLVGDDYLRSDNAIMQSGTGVFTADNTYLRNPVWLTPTDLGFRRANNYVTLFMDVIENSSLYGNVYYIQEDFNDDGTPSELPPGLTLDNINGEITGRVPYQPAITESYKFTLTATRFEGDTGTATIFGTFYEDTLMSAKSFKVGKLNLSGDIDGVDDLNELVTKKIKIYDKEYKVISVDDSNADYDIINLETSLDPVVSLSLTKQASVADNFLFVSQLTNSNIDKVTNSKLNFSPTESYSIDNIVPYLEYTVRDVSFGNVFASNSSLEMPVGRTYNVGEYASYSGDGSNQAGIYQLLYGDLTPLSLTIQQYFAGNVVSPIHGLNANTYNGAAFQFRSTDTLPSVVNADSIYFLRIIDSNTISIHSSKAGALNANPNIDKLSISGGSGIQTLVEAGTTFTAKAQTDSLGAPISDADGNPLLNFESVRWQYITSSQLLLSQEINNAIIIQNLSRKYTQGDITFTEKGTGAFSLRMPSTAFTRLISKVKEFFFDADVSTLVTLFRDNEDKLILGQPLQRNITNGNNIGIALFRRDNFAKDIAVAEEDELVDFPAKTKTFSIRIIGEIDSEIQWITDPDLGTLPANFISTLNVQATSTVPDTSLIYTIQSGRLPFGMRLNNTGELIGKPRQFQDNNGLGLTTFDQSATTFDGISNQSTSFDREFKFVVEAKDRFGLSAVTREFSVKVSDNDNLKYSNLYIRPLLELDQRNKYQTFVSNPDVFTPEKIYRPDDPNFGIQKKIQMLAYSGIETKSAATFVAATAKHHKKRRLKLGDFKTAVAKNPGSTDIVYEVVYIEVIDPNKPKVGNTNSTFNITNKGKITVDSIEYAVKDDNTNLGSGVSELAVYGRQTVRFVVPTQDSIIIDPRAGSDLLIDADNEDFTVTVRDGQALTITLLKADSEPMRIRPNGTTIKADNNSVTVGQNTDNLRYNVNIDHMRTQLELTGSSERLYLPLWMRTPQIDTALQELDYTTAIPVCYCNPGESASVLLNINNQIATGQFNIRDIDFTIDRYIVDRTLENVNEQYIMFPDYQYNV